MSRPRGNEKYVGPHVSSSTKTSSCYVAADAIRTIKADTEYDSEQESVCGHEKDYNVAKAQISNITDNYSGHLASVS
ncbi:hypothetical protein LTR56_026877 [Elasticomyces elasticus]|nr:hypothetical protein LTR22_027922 [Elasticomyces elasticus]KAK3614998.1 hypothetical protein LTR56_026877 [Elasticomyces elasticus]KAK4896851.1 hypothetical protein LTR49_028090 [Elasticomyces elasticus]KAK5735401.1 hypothetical protein LTS12_026481 [Elasticomyces elasticus]